MSVHHNKTLKFACNAALLCVLLSMSAWASDYQEGLTAYIDGDFVLAQQFWLKAANQKDAKSMFNLGLLHEQNKLENSSIDKALNWYKLAADNGYSAASYHLAQRMLERGGSDDDAMALIQSAADSGYAPARRYLNLGNSAQQRHSQIIANVQSSPTSKIETNITKDVASEYQSESWINRQLGKNWTIQLLAFKSEAQVVAFMKDHDLQGRAGYFTESSRGEVFYKLVYGSFDSKDKATFARQNLSNALTEHGPWLRTWASVQEVTKR